eukprot:XP_011665904.1 PREDICTED: sulfotransferase 1C4-like [Strongylocentrotus purpuratus]
MDTELTEDKGNLSDVVKDICYNIDGMIMPKSSPARYLLDIKHHFEVRPDDIFLITYPKSGTTWMQHIVSLIMANGDVTTVNEKHVFQRAQFLEMSQTADIERGIYEIAAKMASPRFLKTHLPSRFCPTQLVDKKPKIIYVARNPKDAAVSYYHFHSFSSWSLPSYPTWDQFFEDFYHGNSCALIPLQGGDREVHVKTDLDGSALNKLVSTLEKLLENRKGGDNFRKSQPRGYVDHATTARARDVLRVGAERKKLPAVL